MTELSYVMWRAHVVVEGHGEVSAEGKGVRESAVLSKEGRKTWAPAFDVLFVKHSGS